MYNVKYVFVQLVAFMNRCKFNRIAFKYNGNTCWNQLLAMMYGQLCNWVSTEDLITILDAHYSQWYHIGFGCSAYKTNLAYAN